MMQRELACASGHSFSAGGGAGGYGPPHGDPLTLAPGHGRGLPLEEIGDAQGLRHRLHPTLHLSSGVFRTLKPKARFSKTVMWG